MSGGASETRQTTEVNLTPEQKEILGIAMPSIRQFAANPPRLPDFSTVARFDPEQQRGQEMALAAAGTQGDIAGRAKQTSDFLLSRDLLDPASNPALRSTIDAAVRPVYQNLTESVLPNVRSEMTQAGQFGGSRQGIAEGLAGARAGQTAGDLASKIAYQGYQSGLDAQSKALGLAPQTTALQTAPAATTSAVGDVRQSLEQALLSEKAGRFSYDQLLPLMIGKELTSMAAGFPGAGATTTATGPQPNPITQALGMGAMGASLAGSLPKMGASFGSLLPFLGASAPATAGASVAAAESAAALLPLVALSDERAKEDVEQIGTLFDGQPFYRFRYTGSPKTEVGLIAQNVQEAEPEAVFDLGGVLAVDYERATENAAALGV